MYLFIINKKSAHGKGETVWRKVEKELLNYPYEYDVVYTNLKGTISIPNKSYHSIIVVGGDGTINAVIQELANRKIPLGVIPAGSGNDFARALNIPFDHKQALEKIINSKNKQSLDSIIVNGNTYCITVVGVGFDGLVAKVTNESKHKKRLGKFAYLFYVIKLLFQFKPTTVTIKYDDKVEVLHQVWFIAVANLPFYGGGLHICPSAIGYDGYLNVCIVKGVSKFEILRVLPRVYSGKHITHPAVHMRKCKKMEILADVPLYVQGDGEYIQTTPAVIEIAEKSIYFKN
ncbi:diacylglycerol/lipid kinase family protein [Anaerobacillus sp. MEB173]|uniref:diacylglycerol/lipid kinase family protein n=1 Tax=Anaerobacillus sp. MEB173 TaxID=3383345 RepID=UPI003F92C043